MDQSVFDENIVKNVRRLQRRIHGEIPDFASRS